MRACECEQANRTNTDYDRFGLLCALRMWAFNIIIDKLTFYLFASVVCGDGGGAAAVI